MDARFARGPWFRVLIAQPRHHALGLLIPDVLTALHVARASRVPLLMLPGRNGEDSPLLRLEANGVRRIHARLARSAAARCLWSVMLAGSRTARRLRYPRNHLIDAAQVVAEAGEIVLVWVARHGTVRGVHRHLQNRVIGDLQRWWDRFAGTLEQLFIRIERRRTPDAAGIKERGRARAETWRRGVKRWLERRKVAKLPRTGPRPQERVLAARRRVAAWLDAQRRPTPPGREIHHGFDIRRLSAEHPVTVHFSAEDDAEARAVAESLGLLGVPLVALHVREGGSKREATTSGFARDTARDARIETYLPAIDELVHRGFTVVRIGDPTMTPVRCRGLVDLATHPRHSALFDFWCVARSRFLIAGDSGPYLLSWLFDVPCVAVNNTNILGVFPLRASDLYTVKRLENTRSGCAIPLSEMLTEEFLANLRRRIHKEGSLRWLDNSEEDILDAVVEMVQGLDQKPPETPLQAAYRRRVAAVRAGALVRTKLHEKAGADEVFLGDGRVSCAFVERYFGATVERAVEA